MARNVVAFTLPEFPLVVSCAVCSLVLLRMVIITLHLSAILLHLGRRRGATAVPRSTLDSWQLLIARQVELPGLLVAWRVESLQLLIA